MAKGLSVWRGVPQDPRAAAAALLEAWLAGRKPTTLRTYRASLDSFAKFLGVPTREEAAGLFLGIKKAGQANKLVLDYKNWIFEQGKSSSTASVRMAALKSLAQLGRISGQITWTIEIKPPKVEAYRDTRGCGFEKIKAILNALAGKSEAAPRRDRALIAFLGILGLRRGEAVGLDVSDVDLPEKRLYVLGKARTDQEPMTIPRWTLGILQEWLQARGDAPGPLFTHFGPSGRTNRLSGRSVGRICHAHGLGHAHGLRHAAITRSLDKNGGNVRRTAKFSRHKNVQTLLKYDDNRLDEGGEVAKDLDSEL